MQKGLVLQKSGPDRLAVWGDSMKLNRIAQNLLLNAIKYTKQGSVSIGWQPGSDDNHWDLIIADTGPGLSVSPSADRGEGIGLTITRQLCQLLDGHLHVDSQPGVGTRFTLTFPTRYAVGDLADS